MVLLVVLAVIAYPLALLAVAWTHLGRVDALPADTSATPGRTYLVVGSDSRKGLTKEQAQPAAHRLRVTSASAPTRSCCCTCRPAVARR